MSRILVGQLWQESHDFNPVLTEASDFAVERGEEMLRANAQAVSTLGGILRTLAAAGATLMPALAARARPGGTVRREVYEGFKAEILAAARAALAAEPALRDISIFNVHPWHNVSDLGQAVIAIAADDHASADTVATAIARDMWAWRDRFRDDFLSTDAALDLVAATPARRPFVLSDAGDRVLAGAPGDGLEILARLRARGLKLKGVFPVTDPAAAAAAIAAGPDASIDLSVGATVTRGFTPLRLTWRVVRTDPVGDFVQKGPFQGGQRSTLGPCAVLADDAGNLVLVTTAAAMTQDPAAFTSQGIDLAACDFVVAKSGNHFKLSFAGVAEPVMVRTAGLSTYTPGFFPYSKSRFYPEDRTVALPTLRLRRFGRSNPSDSEIPA